MVPKGGVFKGRGFCVVASAAALMAELSWDDFRYVKAIAERRSLASAAEALGVNHSTVFRRLAHIEDRLGSRLFERNRAGYALTPCGEEMVHLAERMGEDIIAFERKVTGHDLRPSGELRITTNDTLIVHLLPEVFAAFREHFPEIRLDVVISNQSLNLSRRDADIAIRATDRPPETLIGRRVASIAWTVFGPLRLAQEAFDLLHDVRRRDWVGFADELGGLKQAKWLRDRAGMDRIVYKASTVLGMAEASAAGIGLVLLPCFIGSATPGLVQLTAPDPELEAGLWLLTHPDLRHTARVRAFMDFAGAEIAKRRIKLEGGERATRDVA
jgi:DNA-binding transcriptional LysR family regulator